MPAIVINLGSLTAAQGFSVLASGDNPHGVGYSVSNAGDINGDGIDDLIVGAPFRGDFTRGGAYVIYGRNAAFPSQINLTVLSPSDGFMIQGSALNGRAGRSVSNAGDINGDGIDDLIVGAPYADSRGVAYVIYGKEGAARANIDLSGLASSDGFKIRGDAFDDFTGISVSSAGDINGDGVGDLIVGARFGDNGGYNAGEAYVIYGKAGATRANIELSSFSANDGFIIQGDATSNRAGSSVSSAGDVNGDGIDDLIVGAPRNSDSGSYAGAAYVIFGKIGATRANIDLTSLTSTDGFAIQGAAAGDLTGYSVSNAGDINGDGLDDLIVGAPFSDSGGTDSGSSYVIYGKAGNTRPDIDLTNLTAADGFRIKGGLTSFYNSGWYAGWSVSDAGDIDGDGIDDLIIGAPSSNGRERGGAYVVFGKAGATRADVDLANLSERDGLILPAAVMFARAGRSVSSAGDINGDGFDDLMVGAPFTGNQSQGWTYVIYGSAAYTSPAGALNGTAVADILNGTTMADQISGLNGNDTLWGGAGNDTLEGGDGDDLLDGGAGDDLLEGGTGSNALIGGDGIDMLRVSVSGAVASISGFEAVELFGGAILTLTGTQFRDGLAKNSALNGTGTVTVNMDAGVNFSAAGMSFATTVATVVNGTNGIDIIKLGLGASTGNIVNSGDGVDQVRGSNGVDTINGGIGNDKIMALGGADVLTGGAGNDQFRFFSASDSGLGAAADRVTDFTIGGDRLNFLLIDADAVTAGDQAFNFVGTAAFTNTGIGQIRYQNSGADLLVQADVNGDGVADMEIILQGKAGGTLTAADFIL